MSAARTIDEARRHPLPGEPTWGLVELVDAPQQGEWTEEEYLALDTNHFVEFVDGCLEFPSMPSPTHQWVAGYLYRLLFSAVADRGLGKVWHAPYRVRVPNGHYREPDVVCILKQNAAKAGEKYAESAGLVVEVSARTIPTGTG